MTGSGPAFSKVSSIVIYDVDELDRWLAERQRSTTSDGRR